MYKYLILLLISGSVWAEGPVVDPNLPNQKTWTITCTDPIEREDGTPLDVGEIATRNFYVSVDTPGNWTPAGTNTTECKQVYDLTSVTDGQYYYAATAVDTDGRESIYSTDIVALQVKRLANPRPPGGLIGGVS